MTSALDLTGQLAVTEDLRAAIEAALYELRSNRIVERIWQKDHSVWSTRFAEISDRLGWLDVSDKMRQQVGALTGFADELRAARFRHVVLLGMGGSSLCPEVLRRTFPSRRGHPELIVLDSTVPAWIRRVRRHIDPSRTLFLVSSKSGGTIEVLSFFRYFWEQVEKKKGGQAGENFVAITDPDTRLDALATQNGFRRTFRNPPDIGGRYSALSYFGLVPAASMGIDVLALLDAAQAMTRACQTDAQANPAAWLGAALGALAKLGRDKVSLVASPAIASFGLWAEQLIAESTGKDGRGIVPIALEPLAPAAEYSADRLFVVLRLAGDTNRALDRHVSALKNAGQPVMTIALNNRYDLGAEFFRWEMATAIAGHLLGIHPFNQPDVQESKDNTQHVLDRHKASGTLSKPDVSPYTPEAAHLDDFLRNAREGDYVALMAYLNETPAIAKALTQLRSAILARYRLPNTLGYGPRYLHSTGQLHKGGANNGVFIQLTSRASRDLRIPGELFSFGALASAQADGDLAALRKRGRRVIRIELGARPAMDIRQLALSIGGGFTGVARPRTAKRASTGRGRSGR